MLSLVDQSCSVYILGLMIVACMHNVVFHEVQVCMTDVAAAYATYLFGLKDRLVIIAISCREFRTSLNCEDSVDVETWKFGLIRR